MFPLYTTLAVIGLDAGILLGIGVLPVHHPGTP